jgi:predicted nucleic acid-binding protein
VSRRIFLDTSYAVALAAPSDRLHREAQKLSTWLQEERPHVFTTRAVLLEIGNALSKPLFRQGTVRLLMSLETDPRVQVIPISDDLFVRGLELFYQRRDKSWGLVDCISFEVMREHAVNDSLTSDGHFEQAGFRALLRA